jgi:DNA invertase Pin-like site-specific DNA recombinase
MRFGLVRSIKGCTEKDQSRILEEYGVEIVKPELAEAILNQLESGDEIVVARLLVLSESMELINILQMLENKKVKLTILNQ